MRFFPVLLSRALGVLLGIAAAELAHGQPISVARAAQAEDAAPPSVHQMVVLQGPHRSVHYIASGNLSTSDRLTAYELERAENDLTYLSDLQSLKQQYVNSERIMEPLRRLMQEQLYGVQISYGGSSSGYGGYGGGRGYYPYSFGSYGNHGGNFNGYAGSSSYSVVRSLQFGMGDEGRFKNAMVEIMARESAPDYLPSALHNYDAVAARAAASAVLSRDLGLSKGPATYATHEPSYVKDSKVSVWLGSDKYEGTVKEDRPGWVVLQTNKGEVSVRKSEITRSEVSAKPGQ